MNTASYQEVAHFYMWEGRGPLPNPHPMIYEWFKFCVIDMLPVPVNLFNNLFTSFDANTHKTSNTTVPVAWCTKMQNKQTTNKWFTVYFINIKARKLKEMTNDATFSYVTSCHISLTSCDSNDDCLLS